MELTRGTPRSLGVDAAAVEGFLDALESQGIELHSLMLLRHGQVFAEAHWAPYEQEQVNLLYSLSKSFTSMAAGIAIAEGRFALDDRVVDLVPEHVPADVDDRWRRVTIRDCLRMATGHLDDPPFPAGDEDWLAAFLHLPPEQEPGGVFTYNQMATYTVARLIEASAGERLVDYLRPRLFEPLGVEQAAWLTDSHGHDCGFSGLHVSTGAVARLGQLLLQRGAWEGRQLVPADWIDAATTLQMGNGAADRKPGVERPSPDWGRGYGYQFWMCRSGFRGDGAFGQFCLVLPDHDAVLACTAETDRMQDVLDAVWDHLLPGMAGGGSADADSRLTERLSYAVIAAPGDDGSGRGTGGLPRSGGDAAPSVDAVAIEPAQEGWTVELRAGGRLFRLPIGDATWAAADWMGDPGIPFRCAGGWSNGVFRAQLRMIRTPHTIELVVDPAAGTASLSWHYPPLHGLEPAAHTITGV